MARLARVIAPMFPSTSRNGNYGDTAITVTVHSIDGNGRLGYRGPMARLARVIIPDVPVHVTQRGNGRQKVFFSELDYRLYRDWLGEACRQAKVGVWAWCLMPNHVHLILTPSDEDGLRAALARPAKLPTGLFCPEL